MSNSNIQIRRIFHPIGQGAFYTEKFLFDNGEFTIVYDCGSSTLDKSKLDKKIKSIFPQNSIIDILFISHFHFDHINGIETLKKYCKIKKVFIPYLSRSAKILSKISNYADNNLDGLKLIDNPSEYFGEGVPIISIKATSITKYEKDISSNKRFFLSEITESHKVASGTMFRPFMDIDWYFIPFNYRQNERRINFTKALQNFGLKLSDCNTIDKIIKHKRKISEAYEVVKGSLNENSMILFSGKIKNQRINSFCYNTPHHSYFPFERLTCESGCLYLGDVNLTRKGIVNDIKNKLQFYYKFIGTLQIPHHGSIKNFNRLIFSQNIRCSVISYGLNNSYGHPSDSVIGDLVSNFMYPYLITEKQQSMLIQWGFIK